MSAAHTEDEAVATVSGDATPLESPSREPSDAVPSPAEGSPMPAETSPPETSVGADESRADESRADESRADESLVPGPRTQPGGDAALVARLRAGDESAFAEIVDAWSPMLLRVARTFVSTDASAQEIVQETWLAVLKGLHRFEGRSSLRTWVFRILTNLGKTRGVREARAVPWSSLAPADSGPTVDPARFRGPDDQWAHNWTPAGAPTTFEPTPEDALLAGEIRGEVARALEGLPDRQRVVVSLRDVHGLSADEVCAALDISSANQRVLLHRGRAHLRGVLEDYYRGREVTAR